MKYLRILLLLVAVAAAAACHEDKGTYDYTAIPEVRVASALPADTTIMRGQRLTLTPELKVLLANPDGTPGEADFNPDDYTYAWTAYRRYKGTISPVTLATTQNLDTTIFLPTNADPYHVIYAVTEKATGVAHEFIFTLKVSGGRFASGWLYLTEDDDATVDLMVRGTETTTGDVVLAKEVLANSGFPYRGNGAKFVYYHTQSSITPMIIIGTGEATGYIDKENFEWTETRLARNLMATPLPVSYTFEKIITIDIVHWIDSYGNISPMAPGSLLIFSPINILPPSVTGVGYDTVTVAPFVAGTSSSSTGKLVYDTQNKRMMAYKAISAALYSNSYLQTVTPANRLENHQLYFMQAYDNSRSAVIAKNLDNGKYYHYVYVSATLQDNPEEILNGQLLDQARLFECSYTNGFFYTVIGNKLYAFRSNGDGTGSLGEVRVTNRSVTFDEITCLTRYTGIESVRPHVLLATYAGSTGSGKIYHLRPDPTEPLDVTIEEEITGLDRVKSISRF
jgi:hypothetical protein